MNPANFVSPTVFFFNFIGIVIAKFTDQQKLIQTISFSSI